MRSSCVKKLDTHNPSVCVCVCVCVCVLNPMQTTMSSSARARAREREQERMQQKQLFSSGGDRPSPAVSAASSWAAGTSTPRTLPLTVFSQRVRKEGREEGTTGDEDTPTSISSTPITSPRFWPHPSRVSDSLVALFQERPLPETTFSTRRGQGKGVDRESGDLGEKRGELDVIEREVGTGVQGWDAVRDAVGVGKTDDISNRLRSRNHILQKGDVVVAWRRDTDGCGSWHKASVVSEIAQSPLLDTPKGSLKLFYL